MRIWNRWWRRQHFLLLTLFLRLMRKYNESCCVNVSRNSQNFLNKRNRPNCAPMLVSRRVLTKDNSSLHLMKKDLMLWKTSCREYTLPRSEETSRARGWIRGNTRIGPVLDVKVWYHQGRCGVEIMIESLLRDRTVSWVRIVNGINKYVTEKSEEILVASVENRGTGKLVAKAKPRPKQTSALTLVSFLHRERKGKDFDPGKYSQGCFEVSKFMIRFLRPGDTVHREDDGAVRFDDLAEKFKAKFDGTSQWPIEAWITFLAKGGVPKKRFQYCLNPKSSKHFLYFRAIHGHSGGTLVDPTLQDSVLLPSDFADYIYHIGNAHDMHSIIQCETLILRFLRSVCERHRICIPGCASKMSAFASRHWRSITLWTCVAVRV